MMNECVFGSKGMENPRSRLVILTQNDLQHSHCLFKHRYPVFAITRDKLNVALRNS